MWHGDYNFVFLIFDKEDNRLRGGGNRATKHYLKDPTPRSNNILFRRSGKTKEEKTKYIKDNIEVIKYKLVEVKKE